ncbi:MAG: hypothetical protein IJX88_05795 [Clostridia bacterium]|nr:hypothetical protein [Clostridia bacterium]
MWCIVFNVLSQIIGMERIKIFEGEGKTRDERETYFPAAKGGLKNKNTGAGI